MTDTTISAAVVNPEDSGTGLTSGGNDFISAGYETLPRPDTAAIIGGCDLTPDFGVPDVDLGAGIVQVPNSGISVQSSDQTSFDTALPEDGYQAIIIPSSVTGLGLDASAVNEIYLFHDETSQDSVTIRHGSSVSTPSKPSIKIGEVDTSNNTTSEQWRLARGGELTFPDESAIDSAITAGLDAHRTIVDRATDVEYLTTSSSKIPIGQPVDEFATTEPRREQRSVVALADTDSHEIALRVPDSSTVTVYRWGAFKVADGTAPTGLDVELYDDANDTVQASANTTGNSSPSGVASDTNNSGSVSVYTLRVKNSTGGVLDSPGVCSFFGWEVA
ncbi:hypothetical protein OSG_eHP11_00030 [environmental Halophage eHP-11]|nr:hypothetical protein OSG_eHP11_00030 [environmental Halophage eHP-11]